jgi:fatty-acyl-CoA synthase
MQSTMMDLPLSTQMIFRHGARLHGGSAVRSFDGERIEITLFEDVARGAESLANALSALGVARGERVATFCWNHRQHLEAYLAVPAMGAVLHTLNIRLFPEQVAKIMAHADDRVLIADASLLPQLAPHLELVPGLKHVILVGEGAVELPLDTGVSDYEALLAAHAGAFAWPELQERDAAVVCYTTGTTGDPKGIVYSHRSIFLHTLATLGRDTFGIGQDDRILLLPSMFHANAWGLPFSAWFSGADLIMPGPNLKAAHIRAMVRQARPTITALVPTLANDLLQADLEDPVDMSSFRAIIAGGSPVSPALISRVRERWGVPMLQGWGMTETSPMCCVSIPPRDTAPEDEPVWRAKSGRPVPGMQVRLVDEQGNAAAEDGHTVGELQLRGPWVTGGYHKGASTDAFTDDGWLRTGDVGTIDTRGYVQVTDRSKDVIKSGGEWVSSVDLENQLAMHPDVFEAAVIGIPDPRWEERPLVLVVPRPGAELEPAVLRAFLDGKVARFWLPEYFAFPRELPKTSVGKIDKKEIRRLHADGAIVVRSLGR